MKLDWQWPGAVVFAVVFVTLGALVYAGKLPHEGLYTLLAWLIPSPMQKKTVTEEVTTDTHKVEKS